MTVSASAAPGVRALRRAAVEAELLEVGRRHLAEHGAAGLSIRAVARDLGMVPSALFRYVSGRDELLTRLIVAAYTSLGDAVVAAHASAPPDDPRARFWTLAQALRAWALAHPHEWALVFGTPVPQYEAPGEQTTEPATVVPALLVGIGADVYAAGEASPPPFPGADELALHATEHLRGRDAGRVNPDALPPVALANGITAWTLLVGAVSSELFGHQGPNHDPAQLFDYAARCAEAILFG
ncbi:MAG: TetR/AcrR family transcriptional regulator [Tetrasphaera sp.]|nr:TetR/AcrR family transcriptional regulator [Tetrasphaera sp.]